MGITDKISGGLSRPSATSTDDAARAARASSRSARARRRTSARATREKSRAQGRRGRDLERPTYPSSPPGGPEGSREDGRGRERPRGGDRRSGEARRPTRRRPARGRQPAPSATRLSRSVGAGSPRSAAATSPSASDRRSRPGARRGPVSPRRARARAPASVSRPCRAAACRLHPAPLAVLELGSATRPSSVPGSPDLLRRCRRPAAAGRRMAAAGHRHARRRARRVDVHAGDRAEAAVAVRRGASRR